MENLEVSRSTVYRYCKAKHINTNPTKNKCPKTARKTKWEKQKIELFKRHYNRNLSIKENQEKLRIYGLNLSVGTLQNWINKHLPIKDYIEPPYPPLLTFNIDDYLGQ